MDVWRCNPKNACHAGMVGYSNAVDIHPDLTPAEYEAILPSDQAMFNRSVYADSTSLYPLQSWIPQVGQTPILSPSDS